MNLANHPTKILPTLLHQTNQTASQIPAWLNHEIKTIVTITACLVADRIRLETRAAPVRCSKSRKIQSDLVPMPTKKCRRALPTNRIHHLIKLQRRSAVMCCMCGVQIRGLGAHSAICDYAYVHIQLGLFSETAFVALDPLFQIVQHLNEAVSFLLLQHETSIRTFKLSSQVRSAPALYQKPCCQ